MHSSEVVAEAFARRAEGLPARQVAKELGLPRTTVRTWLKARSAEALVAGRRPAGPSAACAEGRCPYRVELDEEAHAYVFGLYLGDGCVTPYRRRVDLLRITCSNAYPSLLDECELAIGRVMPTRRVRRAPKQGCVDVGSYSTHWRCLLPQAGPGPKHRRPIRLEPWQRELVLNRHPGLFVRGLIHSDGCRSENRVTRPVADGTRTYTYTRYFFSNESADIRALF
jgi:hypothetical protein